MKLAIYGYGNLGRGVECAAQKRPDVQLVSVFTRRDPSGVHCQTDVPVYRADEIVNHVGEFDVLLICGGSATDLPEMTPHLVSLCNVLDSFDTHAKIPTHFENVDKVAKDSGHIALISAGWDPGLFSLARLYGNACLPDGTDYTFWGRGVSQGHSDAIRRIDGVQDARQYTVPSNDAMDLVHSGSCPSLTTRQKHTRECYVVLKPGADKYAVYNAIVTMPNYFADYDTTVNFISQEELDAHHRGLPHGGHVIRTGKTGMQNEHGHTIDFSLTLDSNPEFTAGVLVAYAVAINKMYRRGITGCKTVFDVAPGDLSWQTPEELRSHLL